MKRLGEIKGIIFDYGGTIDTNGQHWAEVLWEKYQEFEVPVTKEQFMEAYVHGERTLALTPLIKPDHNFYDVLLIKVNIQIAYLNEKKFLQEKDTKGHSYDVKIASSCYEFVKKTLETTRGVVEKLSTQHKLVLVSNFYGNIETILKDFNLLCFFKGIIESSVVGVRKPDPAIFNLGVVAMGYDPQDIIVVGDSFSKDIQPANKVGCKTVWLKGKGWQEEVDDSLPDAIIYDVAELPALLAHSETDK